MVFKFMLIPEDLKAPPIVIETAGVKDIDKIISIEEEIL